VTVVFRVDASNRIGTGHFVRCLTLAEALRDRGTRVHFICRAHDGYAIEPLRASAIPYTVLPVPERIPTPRSIDDYSAWLGVSQDEDAEQTIEALARERPEYLLVDHYGINIQWEQRLRPHVDRLMVIDDLTDRQHDCDLLLNQNYSTSTQLYSGLIPDHCQTLLGPCYALIKPEYLAYRRNMRERTPVVHRVFVFFGGSDLDNLTGKALEALSTSEFKHLIVDVVVGANNPHQATLKEQVALRDLTNLYGPRQHLADLMGLADAAIGAGGATTWERMCLGLPSLVVAIADNQIPACEALSHAGLIQYAGDYRQIDASKLREALARFLGDAPALESFANLSPVVADGLGVLRVCEALNPTRQDCLQLRHAREDDAGTYFNWANDPEARRQSFHSEPLVWADHLKWFRTKLAEPLSKLFVFEAGPLPVGQIRFDLTGDEAFIDYSLDALVRGRGWASRLVSMGATFLQQSGPITLRAKVKPGNDASRAVFRRLGFVETQPIPSGTWVYLASSSKIAGDW
jgi:UDP-2,4-diacetamido-2,4,6-trideoxy-beta-L-altropyranose hydrolase